MSYTRVLSLIKQLELAILEMQSGCPPKKRKQRRSMGDHRGRLWEVIDRAGSDGVTSSVMLRATSNISRDVRTQLLEELIATGLVRKTTTKPTSDLGGRPTIRYFAGGGVPLQDASIVTIDALPVVIEGLEIAQGDIAQEDVTG